MTDFLVEYTIPDESIELDKVKPLVPVQDLPSKFNQYMENMWMGHLTLRDREQGGHCEP